MKIGLVLSKVPGYSETFIRSKISGLIKMGHEVTLFTDMPDSNGHIDTEYRVVCLQEKKGSLKYLRMGKLTARLMIFRARRFFRFLTLEKKYGSTWFKAFQNVVKSAHILSHDVDILHFEFAALSVDRECVAKTIGAHMSASLRGYDIAVYPLKHPGVYDRLWTSLDRLHYLSDDLLKRARSQGMSNSVLHQKITPAIDTNIFTGKSHRNSDIVTITTVARLHWIKGYVLALQTMSELKKRKIDFQYRIVGEGEEEAKLRYLTRQYGLENEVHFLGQKNVEDVKREMEICDVFLMSSLHEGFCNAVLEAQVSGCLCVVTSAGGLNENVLHGQTGWVVQSRNPIHFADAIQYAVELTPDEAERIREKARKRVKRDFNLENHLNEWDQFYQQMTITNNKFTAV